MKRIIISKELKEFEKKHLLSSSSISFIFGVTEKEVEMWEKGEKGMTIAEATLLEVLDNFPEVRSYLFPKAFVPAKEKKKEKTIPKKYMFKGSYENGGFRDVSPVGKELAKIPFREIECPNCGQKHLEILDYGEPCVCDKFIVECTHCYWQTPTGFIGDYGEAPCEFKYWYEAFCLMGKPKERVNEDLTLYFYPEGEWREKEREEIEKERKEKRK
jgi:hypothetical protein